MIIVGIDPGITGAVAAISTAGGFPHVYDTPVEQQKKAGGNKKTEYLPTQMADVLRNCYKSFDGPHLRVADVHVFIEQVSAMPGQGVTSMFSFGKGFGLWLGIVAALQMPYTLVTPQRWKRELMAGIKDKDAARGRAQQLFPRIADQLSRKRDIGRADALLIAEYGRITLK